MIERTVLGLLLATLLSAAAYRLRALSSDGAVAAAAIGTIVLGLGGWTPAVLLVLFFVSSSIFTALARLMEPTAQGLFAKGGRRDARQVLANGLLPAVFVLLNPVFPLVNWLAAIVGALAAAAADTWATEWGVFARRQPRRITDWKLVPTGTSGGITPLGTLGSVTGAFVIGLAASLMQGVNEFLLIGLLSGVLGSALDSVLGATIQAQYLCRECDQVTEQHPVHNACGAETSRHSGLAWVDNDVVNLFANAFGAIIALLWIG